MQDRIRVNAVKEKREILEFCVQYEARIIEKWQPIIRYDTAHGYAHRDIIHFDGSVEKEPLYFVNYNFAFTFATQDLRKSWRKYREKYKQEVSK